MNIKNSSSKRGYSYVAYTDVINDFTQRTTPLGGQNLIGAKLVLEYAN